MNDNFDFNSQNNEITMSNEEKKAHTSTFSKLCLSYFLYFIIIELLAFGTGAVMQKFFPQLLQDYNISMILTAIIQYAIAFPIFVLFIKKLPTHAPQKNTLSGKKIWKYATISMFLMYVGNYISTTIIMYMEEGLGTTPDNYVEDLLGSTNIILSIVIVGIIGPIVEELMFRKLFIDRLTPYGEVVAIFFPSLVFGLIHGNLYQFFYAFLLGVAFSYIYVKSGKIIYSTLLHIFINLFCGVLPSYIMGMLDYDKLLEYVMEGTVTEEYIEANLLPLSLLGIYEMVFFVMVFAGVFMLSRNLRYLRFNKGEVRLPRGESATIMFFNVGAIALITYCVITIAINTFS